MEVKININTILNKSNKEDLIPFIKRYAQQDPKFGLMLKTYLSHHFEKEILQEHLNHILDNVIRPKTSGISKLSRSNYQLFLKIMSELKDQIDDKIALELYEDSKIMLVSCLNKIIYVQGVHHMKDNTIQAIYDEIKNQTIELLNQDLAPELREELIDELLSIAKLSYYPFSPGSNILDIFIGSKSIHQTRWDDLLSIIQSSLKEKQNLIYIDNILLTYFRMVYHLKIPVDHEIIESYDPESIKNVFVNMYRNKLYQAILYSIDDVKEGENLKQFDEIKMNTYEAVGNKTELEKLLFNSFISCMDFRYFDKLKRLKTSPQWNKYIKKIEPILQTDQNMHHYAQFLKKENQFKRLANLLKNSNDWELIKDFSFYLFENNRYQLVQVYQFYINHIINEHDSDVEKLEDLFRFTTKNNDIELTNSLKNYLDKIQSKDSKN